jgi:phosphohistidine phosphatase
MFLYLIRHGIAIDHDDPECPPDPERYLTRKGIEKSLEVGKGLRQLGVAPGAVYSSPYIRAKQTAEHIAPLLRFPRQSIQLTETLLPMARPADFLRILAKGRSKTVLAFGHAPNLDEIVAFAIGAPRAVTELKKAGVACVEFDDIRAGNGVLMAVWTPKVLRALGKL